MKVWEVLELTAAAAGLLLLVQLRLDADWLLRARPAPLDLSAAAAVALTLEEAKLPGGVLHALPLLREQQGQRGSSQMRTGRRETAAPPHTHTHTPVCAQDYRNFWTTSRSFFPVAWLFLQLLYIQICSLTLSNMTACAS